jgi:predicted nuclease of restriction endonuclease-like (RecB) superfamily
MDKVRDPEEAERHAAAALEAGWSRDILAEHIESDLYQRQVEAPGRGYAERSNANCGTPPGVIGDRFRGR